MSKGQIQRYDARTINGKQVYWCNILRTYVELNPHKRQNSFYPPINNGRNQLAGKAS